MIKTRKIFPKLLAELSNHKILLLIWPRQVGKTTLLKQLQKEVGDKKTFFVNLEFADKTKLLDKDPLNIFQLSGIDSKAQQIIFIDEVQYLANPSNFLKLLYDEYHENMKLVVSGSSSFYIDRKFKDSLMWRKKMFELFTLDFEEFLNFREEEKLRDFLFCEKKIPLWYKNRIEELFFEYITYWGYPEVVLTSDTEQKIELLASLSSDYIKKDLYDTHIEGVDKFFAILRILANQVGELVNMKEIANTLELDVRTVEKYLYIMKKSYSLALVKPFWTNVRAELIKMPKVFFFDLGLRNAFLNDFKMITERIDKGKYFENLVWREFVLKYWVDTVQYWRDQNKNEIDFIIKRKQAYEVKFSKNLIREKRYDRFKEKYPEIPLEFITFENILTQVVTG